MLSFDNLKLVLLDYPKQIIRNPNVKNILSDIIQAKQVNFERSELNYVPMSGLDMISSHCLIYETSSLYQPKLISAIRICYQDRCEKHKIPLPCQSYSSQLPDNLQLKYKAFVEQNSPLADCGSMFIDSSWSGKKASIPILEIGLVAMYSLLLKQGYHQMIAATNEKYRVSKVVGRTGTFDPQNIFTHPDVESDHLMILMEKFNLEWLYKKLILHNRLYFNREEIIPEDILNQDFKMTDQELLDFLERHTNRRASSIRESGTKAGKPIAS